MRDVDLEDFIVAWCVAVAVHKTDLTGMDVETSMRMTRERRHNRGPRSLIDEGDWRL